MLHKSKTNIQTNLCPRAVLGLRKGKETDFQTLAKAIKQQQSDTCPPVWRSLTPWTSNRYSNRLVWGSIEAGAAAAD